MASIKDKNLLFYSILPNDEHSKGFLQELEKNPHLKKQFILVCVNDPNIKIPDKIRQLNKIPVLIAAGFSQPIFGQDAVSWLKNNSFQDKGNGFEFGSLDKDDSKYAWLSDETRPSDYNQFFNNEYNNGFAEKDGTLSRQFANLKTDAHITTFDDASEMKKDISGQLEKRLNDLRQQRDTDVPRPVKRIGGLDEMQTPQRQPPSMYGGGGGGGGNGFGGGGNGGAPTYNPNPFAVPQVSHQQLPFSNSSQPPLPFSMPRMPSMSRQPQMGSQMGPRLPFNMPQIRNPNLHL